MTDPTPAMTAAMVAHWKTTARRPLGDRLAGAYAAGEARRLADLPQPLPVDVPLDLSGYEPVFRDDFTGALDGRWKVITDETQWGGELAAFTPESLSIENDQLVFTARHLDRPVDGRDYATGAVSLPDLAMLYGYIEFRLWMDLRNGAHPAAWLYPASRKWTTEIDVFEYKGVWHFDEDRVRRREADIAAARALGKTGPKPIVLPDKLKDRYLTSAHANHGVYNAGEVIIAPVNRTWNTFGLEWTPTHLNFTRNGVRVRSIVNEHFHEPMYPILNLGIGTPMAIQGYGDADPDLAPADFPQTLIADHVAVWARA